MTDRVDLDALDIGDEDESEGPRRGDWFWHNEGNPADDSSAEGGTETDTPGAEQDSVKSDDGEVASRPDAEGADAANDADDTGDRTGGRVPHVPRENENKPVGIPVEGGGAGGTSARAAAAAEEGGVEAGADSADDAGGAGTDATTGEATDGVHADRVGHEDESPPAGDGTTVGTGSSNVATSEMTMAFTYDAVKRLASPILVLADAEEWTDWIGIVGDVDAYVINKFVREEGLDIDFFNGAGTTPTERLTEITTNPNSMFAAERTVLVGTDGEQEIAARADWEFVPLADAADAAGWDTEA